MAERIGTTLVFTPSDPGVCEGCGKSAELRPYGKDGASVCIACADKDPTNKRARMIAALTKLLEGVTHLVGPEGQVVKMGQPFDDPETPRKNKMS
jgi:hypothetical protein